MEEMVPMNRITGSNGEHPCEKDALMFDVFDVEAEISDPRKPGPVKRQPSAWGEAFLGSNLGELILFRVFKIS